MVEVLALVRQDIQPFPGSCQLGDRNERRASSADRSDETGLDVMRGEINLLQKRLP